MMFIRSKADCLSECCFAAVFKFPLTISLSLAREEQGGDLNFKIMSTNNLFAPKLVPVSTMCFYIVFYMGAILLFAMLFNPLTLFIFNLFAPAFAAALVHKEDYCGKTICKFYTWLALKWPFRWAKWWITPDLLKNYTIEEQITYFQKVNNSKSTFWKLKPEAWVKLVKNNGYYPFSYLAEGIQKRDDLFTALLDLTISEQKVRSLIREYMETGTLLKSQMNILIEKACTESETQDSGIVGRLLCDYIERCGISKELMTNITTNDKTSESLKKAVVDSVDAYLQKLTTKRLFDMDTFEKLEEWVEFCAPDKKICVAAQKEMSYLQYQIFNQKGHHLDAAAIMHLLWNRGKNFAEMIFSNEPKFGILNNEIQFILDKHNYLRPALQEIIEYVEKDLRHRICDYGEELTEEQLNQMFDCPNANNLALEYISLHSLPSVLHKRMLELDSAEEIIKSYVMHKDYQLDEAVRVECEKRGWDINGYK